MWGLVLSVALSADPLASAREAYEKHDFSAFLKHMRDAEASEPTRPRVLLALASAQALGGAPDEVAPTLERLAAMGLAFEVTKDDDFKALRERPDFQAAVRHFAKNRAPVGRGTPLFTVAKTELVEGVAFDAQRHRYLVADVRGRRIVAVDERTGATTDFAAQNERLGAVFGLLVEPKKNRLWATTSDVPQMNGFDQSQPRRAALLQFDLASGKQLKAYRLADGLTDHVLGDLTQAPSGEVFVSDSTHPVIYRVAGDALEKWVDGPFRSLQGLAFSPDGRQLYVADYSLGLFVVDVATKKISVLKTGLDVATVGIDGLYAVRGGLLATQNGVEPQRVIRFDLDATGSAVTGQHVLFAQDPSSTTADFSLGCVVGTNFVLNAHSGWVDFEDGGAKKSAMSSAPNSFIVLPLGP